MYVRSAVLRACLLGGVLFTVLFTLAALAYPPVRGIVLLELLVGLAIFPVVIPRRIRASHRGQWIAKMRHPDNAGFLGEKTLEATPTDLFSISENGSSIIKWSAIKEIISTDTEAFFLLGNLQAINVPRAKVAGGNFDAFVEEARRLHAAATAAKGPIPLPAR